MLARREMWPLNGKLRTGTVRDRAFLFSQNIMQPLNRVSASNVTLYVEDSSNRFLYVRA